MSRGQVKRGEAKRGEGVLTQTINAPVTTLTLSTPEPTVEPSGPATIEAPVTTLTLTTPTPEFRRHIEAPVTTLTLSTPEPTVEPSGPAVIDLTGIDSKRGEAKRGEAPRGGGAGDVTTLELSTPEPEIGFPFWQIDGAVIEEHTAETRTWQTLDLVFRVDDATLTNDLSPLKDTAEKLEIVPSTDGQYRALDRAPTDGIYTLTPPVGRTPPRTERDYLVGQYRQRVLDQANGAHEVNVSFVAETDREPDGTSTSETRASGEWSFAFRSATIATKRVQYDRQEATNKAADTFDLPLILDAEQTKVVEESASRLAAVSVREVPDGPNTVDDDSSNPSDANTVTITTPDGETPIADGQYVVQDWSTEWLSSRGYRVTLTVGSP